MHQSLGDLPSSILVPSCALERRVDVTSVKVKQCYITAI